MIVSCPNPQCRIKLKIDDSLAGRQGRCPHCNTPFMIPTLDEVSEAGRHPHRHHEPPPAAAPAQAPAPHPAPHKSAVPPAAMKAPPPVHASAAQESPPPMAAQAYPAPAPPPTLDAFSPTPQPHPFASSAPAQPPVPGLPSKALLDGTISSLAAALSPRKLLFFVIGWAATMLLCFLLLWLAPRITTLIGAIILVLGLSAVIVGGIARLAHANRGLGDAFSYCLRRFLALFLAGLLVPLALLIVSALLNGLIMLISSQTKAGSYAAAVLFGPQFVINLLLAVASLVTVIVPCAIVVEECGVFHAVGRLLFCLRRQAGAVMTQIGLGIFFAGIITLVLLALTLSALLPTATTNGNPLSGLGLPSSFLPSFSDDDASSFPSPRTPSPSRGNRFGFGSFDDGPGSRSPASSGKRSPLGFGSSGDDDEPSSFFGPKSSATSAGGWIRSIWMMIIFAAVFSYPAVYWIVSFTNFYKALLPTLPAAGAWQSPPPAV